MGNVFSQTMLISGGNDHGVALCNKGEIFAWGYNKDNRLGLKPPYDSETVVNRPQLVNIPVGLTFSQVSAGSGSHTVALSCKNIVYAWGENDKFQTGQTSGDVVDKPMPVLCGEATNHGYEEDGITKGKYLGDVKKIAATTSGSLALLDDGTAVMWGGNGNYQGGETHPLFKASTATPIFIRDENKKILENIIDIYGGDNNLTLIVGKSPTDMTGTVYSMGNWNGRGGSGNLENDPTSFVAMPVIIADPNDGQEPSADNKTLNAVKTSGIADAGGFAFDENEGFLYSWGNNGWGGMVGLEKTQTYTYASKVIAGEYTQISKEAYMTNVHQVIGGNGYGALVTEDGYLLYMGGHNTTGRDGGIVPSSEWAASTKLTNGTGNDPGPIFAKYCKGEKDPNKEVIVNDAAAIGRGDLFGFMVNKDGDFYVWGNTKWPGNAMPDEVGVLGLGFNGAADDPEGKGYRTCLSRLELLCTPQDECPKIYMIGPRRKCPGETDSLYCGFTPTTKSVRNYFFRWSLNGVVLNESTLKQAQDVANKIASTSDENAVITDPWNNWVVEIKDPGTYKVEIFYIGDNVPCTNCETAEGEIEVIDMDMPIDTFITDTNCVTKDYEKNPTSNDLIKFRAVVNNKFYTSKDDVTFAVFATPTSKDTLKDIDGKTAIFNTTGDGGKINFKVTGDQIDRTLGVETGEDTLYHVWLEDVTKFETNILEQPTNTKTTNNGQRCLILKVFSTSELSSFSVYAEGNTSNDAKITIKPVIYLAGKVKDGNYVSGSVFWEGAPKDTIIPKGKNENGKEIKNKIEIPVKCDVELPGNPARGTEYVLSAIITFEGNGEYYLQSLPAATNMYFDNPIVDSEGYGIQATGTYASNGTGGGYSNTDGVPFYNITFGKMTDYNCGRIMLTARYGCPPCDDPKKLEIIASETIKDDVDTKYKKVVELCKESDELVLDIEPLEGKNDPTAKFDIFWFDKFKADEADALIKDITGSATTLETKTNWATVAGATDIDKDVEKVYYVMVYDHKNPEQCVHYDSIKVIAHPAPVDSLDWIEFCEGELAAEPTFEIAGKKINWIDEPKDVATLTGPTGTGTKEYTYKYTVIDGETGCEGEEHTLTISVNKTGKPDVKENISLLKDPSVKYNLSAAKNDVDPDCEIRWYESETATSEMTNTSITLDEAKTIEVWAEQYNTKTGCVSERVKVVIVINDAPVPEVTNESLCIDNEIPDLSEYVKPKDSDHILNWYDDPSAAKGTGSQTAPSFKATAAGKYNFYVSQTNTNTDAESEKATLTITVHEVATLDLSKNKLDYCINDQAEELTFSAKNDGDFTTANWSKKSDMSDAVATLSPATDEKGEVTYYVQAEYTNADAQKSYAKTVCYGKIQTITITTNKTEVPGSATNYTVQYLKAEGDKNQSYKSLLDQDGTAVKVEPGHSLKWYDENKNLLTSEPAPEYIANETGERKVKYYVSQVNQSTGCESELTEVTVIISSFPAPEVKAITLCQESDRLKAPFPLQATISTKGGFSAADYVLIWYKEDPKSNPSAEEFTTIDLSLEDLTYDATTETEKDFKYWVVQRYNGPGGGQSPAAELLVTIYSKPILKTKTPDPICLGGEVDLKDLYSISNRISNQQYELEYLSANGTNPKGSIATVHGEYQCRAWFELSNDGMVETCSSKFEEVSVTVNELEVAIEGDNTTCPGVGVELTAKLTTKNMGTNDYPSYSWNVSPTGVTGQLETLNTTGDGLVKKGDKLTVNLEVSMGACKGKKPADAHIVTVDDPGVDGTIKFDEQYNTNSGQGTYTLSKNGIVEFDGCNSKVEVAFNVKQTEDEFTYENLETGVVKTGTFSNGEGKFNIKAGLYEVSFINTCKTSFKFEVKDKSLDISGSSSKWSVCEGTPLTIKIVNNDDTPFEYDPKKYKIEWQKDGNTLPNYNTEVLHIPSTTPDDNGVYSYTVTSSGCVYHDKIAMGGSFTSKPKVKIDESLLAKDGIYEVIRTKSTDITIPIIRSTGIDMSTLSDKIVWKEEGVEVNRGETLSLTNVVSDHEYQIVIANGEKGYDTDYCGTNLNITLNVDALLSIKSVLVDGTGKLTKDMCVNEEGVGFRIDTTGTGKILHPDKFTFKVVETIDGKEKEVKMAKKDDYLFAEISPDKSAKYEIVYKYSVGNQDSSKKAEITVHPAYVVEWDRNVRLCEGETGFIQITKAEPASEIELTWESDECLKSGSKNGADVEAVFSGSGLTTRKALTLVASNGGICAEKKYYPEFTIDKAIEGEISAPEFICEGHTATLDASPFHATEYVWSSDDQLGEGVTLTGPSINVVSKTGYATYSVEMKRGACTQTAETTFEVRHAPVFDRIDSLSFRTIEIVMESNIGTPPFQYIVDDRQDGNILEPVKDSLEYGTHTVKVIDAAGCVIDTTFITNAPGFDFPIHISPNNDGVNDAFSIPILRDAYPDANIRIFDRWGKKLADYKAGDSNKDWDGTYNGVQMPSTDYWYEIEIKEINKTYSGHFTLIRQ